jgi:hypothetical protein
LCSLSECWFLIDCRWLNEWHAFVKGGIDEERPGPLSTRDLLDEKTKLPLPKLKKLIDYRAVTPMAYACFVELYGKDRSPELCRYEIDIYKPEIPLDRIVNIKRTVVVSETYSVFIRLSSLCFLHHAFFFVVSLS